MAHMVKPVLHIFITYFILKLRSQTGDYERSVKSFWTGEAVPPCFMS